jgi:hypothetical protein
MEGIIKIIVLFHLKFYFTNSSLTDRNIEIVNFDPSIVFEFLMTYHFVNKKIILKWGVD